MNTVSKSINHCNPFIHLKKELQGDNPYSHLINLYRAVGDCKYHLLKTYQAIETKIAESADPMGWRLIRAELDGLLYGIPELMHTNIGKVFDVMEQVNLIGGK